MSCLRLPQAALFTCLLAPLASADITTWLSEVNTGTPSIYTNTSIPVATNVDIGVPDSSNGVTYEFIVNASNTGTTALMGSRNTGLGNNGGFKFEQYFSSAQYGVTDFGIADYFFPGTNDPDEDVHLLFYSDVVSNKTQLFVNGVITGSVDHAPVLEGLVGLAQIHDPAGDFDVLSGTILGVAIYEGPLSLSEIQSHYLAFSSDIWTPFCDPMDLNCNGMSTTLVATLSSPTGTGLHLAASNGPPSEFGYVLIGTGVADPGLVLSNGRLCLSVTGGNTFGRYNVIGSNLNSVGQFDATGSVFNNLVGTGTSAGNTGFDVPNTVPITGSPMIMAGQTWHFQLWHRDACGGAPASNFSNGLSVVF